MFATVACSLALGLLIVTLFDAADASRSTAEARTSGTPTLKLSAASGPVGTAIVVSGNYFGHSSVQLTWDGNAAGMSAVFANGHGSFQASFVVPSAAAGGHTVGAASASGAAAATAPFIVTAPSQPTPAPTAPPASPTPPPPTATPAPTPSAAPSGTAAPSFALSASASPASVAAGSAVTVTLSAKSATAGSFLVDAQLFDPAAVHTYETWWASQSFSAGQTRTYSFAWTVPSSGPAGTWTVKLGVFSNDWSTLYSWNNAAAKFAVTTAPASPTAAPTATATPAPTATVAPTPAPTPAPTATPAPTPAPTPAAGSLSLRVSGTHLVNGAGQTVQLHGVNRSGTEYACIQGWGISDGPNDAASVQAMKAWNVNFVRVPLNEDCWLGINGVPSAYAGANYVNAIKSYVALLHQNGMYAELSLIWAAPGTYQANYQSGAPDADHSPAMWSSMAAAFAGDPAVILAPWGETIVDANCFLNGGTCEATYGPSNTPYATAGMQQAVNVMRAAGYHGVISIPGIDYANDLTQWLSHKPVDPDNAIVAEAHIYGNNTCGAQNNGACLTNTIAPVAQVVPVLFGETGETYDDSECSSANMQIILPWADAHGVGYAAWTWDTWGTCGSLISNFNGTVNTSTPTGAKYAQYIHDHLLTR